MGLNARFGWSASFGAPFDPPAKLVALGVLLAGWAFASWALIGNRFFSGMVRIQTDRGHQVVSGGPYGSTANQAPQYPHQNPWLLAVTDHLVYWSAACHGVRETAATAGCREMVESARRHVPGLAFVLALALLARYLDRLIAPVITLEALTVGIVLGIICGTALKTPRVLQPGVGYASKALLHTGIVLLGFKLDFLALASLGPTVLLLVLATVPTVLLLACLVGRLVGADDRLAVLIGVGSCICGASAVVAVTPCVRARKEDSVIAVSVVSFLGAIGLLVYSALSVTSGLTDVQYGAWSGLSLHAVGHAVAAAFARGSTAGEIGTLVKMARVALLVPVALVLTHIFGRRDSLPDAKGDGTTAADRPKVAFPTYVLYFILAGIARSVGVVPSQAVSWLGQASSLLILMAMIATGLLVDFRAIKDKGVRGLLVGTLLFAVTATGTYLAVTRLL